MDIKIKFFASIHGKRETLDVNKFVFEINQIYFVYFFIDFL